MNMKLITQKSQWLVVQYVGHFSLEGKNYYHFVTMELKLAFESENRFLC